MSLLALPAILISPDKTQQFHSNLRGLGSILCSGEDFLAISANVARDHRALLRAVALMKTSNVVLNFWQGWRTWARSMALISDLGIMKHHECFAWPQMKNCIETRKISPETHETPKQIPETPWECSFTSRFLFYRLDGSWWYGAMNVEHFVSDMQLHFQQRNRLRRSHSSFECNRHLVPLVLHHTGKDCHLDAAKCRDH